MLELTKITKASIVELSEYKDWSAWINLMPPKPYDIHVNGDVFVTNLGVKAILIPKLPAYKDPTILCLNLVLMQQPGNWPQVETYAKAEYDQIVFGNLYEKVQIYSDTKLIADVPVQEIHLEATE